MVEYSLLIKSSAAKELQVVADTATLARLIERINHWLLYQGHQDLKSWLEGETSIVFVKVVIG